MRVGGKDRKIFVPFDVHICPQTTFLRRRSAVSVFVDCGPKRVAVWWLIKRDTRAVVAARLNE